VLRGRACLKLGNRYAVRYTNIILTKGNSVEVASSSNYSICTTDSVRVLSDPGIIVNAINIY
jgi:hypothetical protein